jgi:hypothetical protein
MIEITDPLLVPVRHRLRVYRQWWKGNLRGFVSYTNHYLSRRLP